MGNYYKVVQLSELVGEEGRLRLPMYVEDESRKRIINQGKDALK